MTKLGRAQNRALLGRGTAVAREDESREEKVHVSPREPSRLQPGVGEVLQLQKVQARKHKPSIPTRRMGKLKFEIIDFSFRFQV